jgi:copper chaperone CopZ
VSEVVEMKPTRLKIESMASTGGGETLEDALRLVPGVMSVRTEPGASDVLVEAAENVEPADLVAAAQKAGYVVVLAG